MSSTGVVGPIASDQSTRAFDGGPLAGMTQWGFTIPQGDPGEIAGLEDGDARRRRLGCR